MAAWAESPVPRRRHLHRRRKQRLLAAQPERQLGQRPDHRGLAPDPHLRRPPGDDLELQQLRQDDHRRGGHAGHGGGRRRGRRGDRDRDRHRQPDLLRHGVLLADHQRHQSRPHLPRSVDRRSCTSSATSPASTPRAAPGSPTSPPSSAPATRSPTTSGSPTGTTRKTRSTRWCRRPPGPTTSASTSSAAATTTPTAASRSTSTATTSTGPRSGSARRRSANRTRSARSN